MVQFEKIERDMVAYHKSIKNYLLEDEPEKALDSNGLVTYNFIIKESKRLQRICGVYFLLNKSKEIIYIGQSTDVLERIIKGHRYSKKKTIRPAFIFAIQCKKEELKDLERKYIRKFRPSLNTSQNDTVAYIPIRLPNKRREELCSIATAMKF